MYGKNPSYKSVLSSQTIQKKESVSPEEKKPSKLSFILNWFF